MNWIYVVSHLDSMPSGVTLRDPISIARDIPGASRSITSLVAWRKERWGGGSLVDHRLMKHVSILSIYLMIYSDALQLIPVGQFQAFKLQLGGGFHKVAGFDIPHEMRTDKHYEITCIISTRPLTWPFKTYLPWSMEQKGENHTVVVAVNSGTHVYI